MSEQSTAPGGHNAKNWVEQNFPLAAGCTKASLIIAYGAGLDAGLAEAQEVLQEMTGALIAKVNEQAVRPVT